LLIISQVSISSVYTLDYIRIVNENGKQFTHKNFFMMLKEIKYTHIDQNGSKFLNIMKEELGVSD